MNGRCFAVGLLLAARAQATPAADAAFPGAGRASIAVATGVPFLVMSELSLGITDHVAVGALGGTTPIVSGFGLRPRAELPLRESLRLRISAPVLFYPAHDAAPPWWLTRPSLSLSADVGDRFNLTGGAGFVAVATHPALFGGASSDDAPSGGYGPLTTRERTDAWWTLNAIATVRVSERTQLFADTTLIFRGLELAGRDWIGGPPFILFLGVSTCL